MPVIAVEIQLPGASDELIFRDALQAVGLGTRHHAALKLIHHLRIACRILRVHQIPLDSVASMEVIADAPPAEFGDKTSVVINVTTRSGQGRHQAPRRCHSLHWKLRNLEYRV